MKLSNRINILLVTLLFSLSAASFADGGQLNEQWELTGLKNPESVVYDPKTKLLYISNVNGAPNGKDGNGFISVASLDGKMVKQEWVGGLNGPKGLAISGNKLYVSDIDTLVEIDIPKAKITNSYKVNDAKFFNDVTASPHGDVYVSDMAMNRIHKLNNDDGDFSIWLESSDLKNPNGLLVDGDRLVVGAWGVMTDGFATKIPGHLLAVSLKSKNISDIGDGSPVGNMDGVEKTSDGSFYVTDWMVGKLFHIDSSGEAKLLLTLNQGMADLEYLADEDLLLIPMMNDNKLIAYKVH